MASADTGEVIGTLTLAGGNNTITSTGSTGTGALSELSFGSLNRSTAANITFLNAGTTTQNPNLGSQDNEILVHEHAHVLEQHSGLRVDVQTVAQRRIPFPIW